MADFHVSKLHKSLHVSDKGLARPEQACLFCGSTDRSEVARIQDDPQVLLLHCNCCCATSASRLPTIEALNEYYASFYEPVGELDRITFDQVNRIGKYLATLFLRHSHTENVRILDFGGGDGSISCSVANFLLKKGVSAVDITVIDYNPSLIAAYDPRISLHRFDTLEGIDLTYDYVIASAVIEHLPTPGKTIERLASLVAANGLFYARTPYVIPLMRLLLPIGIKVDFTYPAHLHDLGQVFWEKYWQRKECEPYFAVLVSEPSILQTSLKDSFFRTVAAFLFKAPWYLFGRAYKLVGGWEILVKRTNMLPK